MPDFPCFATYHFNPLCFDCYQPENKIYQVGAWFILVNKNRQAQITSGDMWFDIPRKEAANWLKHGTPN